ncbi:hypothetical protein RRG08_011705 [Elysia crispata]|uniref:Uncharacterized protein n=1 Tax=Elysia crispata TaxID=231223 RepID=A0AAE1EDD8_9GAST|nr:hypothetical protein RRG08_011705 [Elysia crispata]
MEQKPSNYQARCETIASRPNCVSYSLTRHQKAISYCPSSPLAKSLIVIYTIKWRSIGWPLRVSGFFQSHIFYIVSKVLISPSVDGRERSPIVGSVFRNFVITKTFSGY